MAQPSEVLSRNKSERDRFMDSRSLAVGENQSRRDLTKVAQYEVLGNDAKRNARPGRDDRNV
jgi:hypothetical protein